MTSPTKTCLRKIPGVFAKLRTESTGKCRDSPKLQSTIPVLGIYGDLFASVVKRQCGIKDYGTIFPGHGGILDRFDSVMFIAPFVTMVITAVFYY